MTPEYGVSVTGRTQWSTKRRPSCSSGTKEKKLRYISLNDGQYILVERFNPLCLFLHHGQCFEIETGIVLAMQRITSHRLRHRWDGQTKHNKKSSCPQQKRTGRPFVQRDFTYCNQQAAMYTAEVAHFGGVDIIVNNVPLCGKTTLGSERKSLTLKSSP